MPTALDVVFAIDRSGSMVLGPVIGTNCPDQPQGLCRDAATDPNDLSMAAVLSGVDALYSRVVAQEFVDAAALDVRVGVIAFGADVQTILEPTPLQAVRSADSPGAYISSLAASLPAPKTQYDSLGDATRYSLVFAEACRMFAGGATCADPLPAGRTRLLILLTDGEPQPGANAQNIERLYGTNPGEYFAQMSEAYRPLLNGSTTWLLGVDAGGMLFSQTRADWEQFIGDSARIRLLNDVASATAAMQTIIDQTLGDSGSSGRCNETAELLVEPYRAVLTVIFTHRQIDARAELRTPSGQVIVPNAPVPDGGANQLISYSPNSLSELYIIQRPEPGTWGCSVGGGAPQPDFRLRNGPSAIVQIELQSLLADQVVSTCAPVRYELLLRDRFNQPLGELPNYPLAFTIESDLDPELVAVDYPQVIVTPPEAGGDYQLALLAGFNGSALAGSAVYPLRIHSDYPCAITIPEPPQNSVLPITDRYQPLPVDVLVQLLDGAALPLDPRRSAFVQRDGLQATLQGADGSNQVLSLAWDPVRNGYATQLHNLTTPGVYTITAGLDVSTPGGDSLPGTIISHQFERVDDPAWVRAELVRLGILLVLSLLTLMICALFLGVFFIPPPRGILFLRTPRVHGQGWETQLGIALSAQPRFGWTLRQVRYTLDSTTGLPIKVLLVHRLGAGVRVGVVPLQGAVSWHIIPFDRDAVELPDVNVQLVYQALHHAT